MSVGWIDLKLMWVGWTLLLACGASTGADINKGRQTYVTHCVICHGQSGSGMVVGAPNFDRGDGLMRPDFTLLGAIKAGKNAMPAYRGMLSDRDILDVIAYLRTLH
jgi:cytochrome c6